MSGLAPGALAPRAPERPAPRRRVREASAAVETARSGAALDELQLLSRARRTLATDPALALTLIDQHERRFASGAMDQEREVIAVEALVRLGRLADARSRAQRFAREHAGSVYLGRMQAILSPAAGSP
jgi:hypothetical protein